MVTICVCPPHTFQSESLTRVVHCALPPFTSDIKFWAWSKHCGMHLKLFILCVCPAVSKKTAERIFMNLIPKIFKETSQTILTFKILAVSLCTTRFNIQKFYMLLALRFVQVSEQTATFALYSINLLVFITMVESIYCAVRTDSLHNADYIVFKRLFFL